MKNFKGKAIYNPSGKAGEYSYWACNFYTGCSNNCSYCYCKRGVLSSVWSDKPQLKKCFMDEEHALKVFEKELKANLPELQEHGLFLSFSTDPCLQETIKLTDQAMSICLFYGVPVKILTKRADWIEGYVVRNGNAFIDFPMYFKEHYRKNIAFGFTLTGHDELEPNASTNAERIEAMKKLHEAGFKTFASIEPIIDFESSLDMIEKIVGFCDLYKIGLESGKKYNDKELYEFITEVLILTRKAGKVYFKDSLLKAAGIDRSELYWYCVNRDYNLFNQ